MRMRLFSLLIMIVLPLIFNAQALIDGVKYRLEGKNYLTEYSNQKVTYYTLDSLPIFDVSFENVSELDENGYAWAESAGELLLIHVPNKKRITIPRALYFLVDKKLRSHRSKLTEKIYFPLKEGFFLDENGDLFSSNVFESNVNTKKGLQNEFQAFMSDIEVESLEENERKRIESIQKHLKIKGNWIVEPGFYSEIQQLDSDDLIESLFKVKKNGKWGVLCLTGELILPCQYSKLELIQLETTHELLNYFLVKQKKFGVLSTSGANLIPCMYDAIETEDYSYHSNGHMYGFTVELKNKFGYFLTDGTQLIPCKYKAVDFYFLDDYYPKQTVLTEVDKAKLSCDFYPFSYYGIGVNKDKTMDFYSPHGNFLNQIEVDEFYEASELGYITFEKNGKMGLIGKSACLKIPATKFYITLLNQSNELLIFSDEELENGEFKTELLDENLKPYFDKEVQISTLFRDQLVVFENGKFGLVDLRESSRSKLIWSIEPEYDLITPISSNFWKTKKNKLFGVVNDRNNPVLPIEFESIYTLNNGDFCTLKNGKYTLFNSTGKKLLERSFDSISFTIPRYDQLLPIYVVYEHNKWRFFDPLENGYVNNFEADVIEKFSSNSFKVVINGLQGIINDKIVDLIPIKYTEIDFKKGKFICSLPNGKKEKYDIYYQPIK